MVLLLYIYDYFDYAPSNYNTMMCTHVLFVDPILQMFYFSNSS